MKLFVSALVVLTTAAVATSVFAQNQPSAGSARVEGQPGALQPGVLASPHEMEKQWMQSQADGGVLLPMSSQAWCPVVLTSARLNWPASYLPVTSAERVTEPSLALGFSIAGVQPVQSVTITARLLVKASLYQMDAEGFNLRLTFSGAYAAGEAAQQLRDIRLPAKIHAYGVTRVSLERVTFTNGDVWTAWQNNSCSLNVRGSAERVEAR